MNSTAYEVAAFLINLVLAATVAASWEFSFFIWGTLSHRDPFAWLLFVFTGVLTGAFIRRVSGK